MESEGGGGGRRPAAVASPPLPRDLVLQLRVFAQAELGCAAPTELAPAGLQAGAWEAASLPDCGDGRSLLVLSCTSCVFSAVASLTLTLPYTCQALHVEALAVDATGEVSVMAFPSHLAGAAAQGGGGGGGELLAALQWTLDPMQALVVDTISSTRTRGLRLLGATASSTRGEPAGGLLQPLSAAVVLTFALPLQSSFSVSTISTITTLPELVSSLIGLVGIVGAFRLLFQYAEYALERGGGGSGGGSGGRRRRSGGSGR